MKDFIIFKNLEGKYITLPEYIKASKKEEAADAQESQEAKDQENQSSGEKEEKEEKKEEKPDTVYYVTDEQQQSQYINMFKAEGIDALILTHNIDQPFITQLEQTNQKIRFQRIDADITDSFKEEVEAGEEENLKKETEELTELFRRVLNKEKLEVKVEKLKNDKVSAVVTLSEESRRMQDMMRMYNMYGMDPGMFGTNETLVLNANNNLVQYIRDHKDEEGVNLFCEQLYDLALISHKPLDPEAMTRFVERSNEILTMLAK